MSPEETERVLVEVTVAQGQEVCFVVVVTRDPLGDEGDWSVGIRRHGSTKQRYDWVAKRLRQFCTELELQGILEDDHGDAGDSDRESRPDGQ